MKKSWDFKKISQLKTLKSISAGWQPSTCRTAKQKLLINCVLFLPFTVTQKETAVIRKKIKRKKQIKKVRKGTKIRWKNRTLKNEWKPIDRLTQKCTEITDVWGLVQLMVGQTCSQTKLKHIFLKNFVQKKHGSGKLPKHPSTKKKAIVSQSCLRKNIPVLAKCSEI